MRNKIARLVAVLAVPMIATMPADAAGDGKQGSFVARAVPFPTMQVYYPEKGSCLDGLEGIHKAAEQFRAPAPGTLSVFIEGMSGDWDVYALGPGGRQLGASANAQLLDGAEGKERLTVPVKRHQRVDMVACNWLGEPEVTVHFEFVAGDGSSKPRRYSPGSAMERAPKQTTHRVDASGGPVTPLWEWDPSDLEVSVGDKVVWYNETAADHHVTPYAGPWKNVDMMHLSIDGRVGLVFDKAGEYLYRCDFAFAGVEHSLLVGDECIGMCGRIVVKKRR